MIYFLPCYPEHVGLIDVQPNQKAEWTFDYHQISDMVSHSVCLSAWQNEHCIGAGGIRSIWTGRAAAWVVLGAKSGPAMTAIVRRLRLALDGYPARRIEMTVRADFPAAWHLATLLGFKREHEAPLRFFFPDGMDAYLYSRLK